MRETVHSDVAVYASCDYIEVARWSAGNPGRRATLGSFCRGSVTVQLGFSRVLDMGRISHRQTRHWAGEVLRRAAAPAAILGFWGGMAAAAHAYRPGYDWRYQTISVLLYRDQNPGGYAWAWAGLWLCGLAGVAWTTARLRRFAGTREAQATGLRFLQLGFLCMTCAVLPDRLLPWPRGHEAFAIAAFLGLCVGITRQMFVAVNSREARASGQNTSIARRFAALLPLAPLLFAASTQAYLALARPNLPWVTPRWRTLGVSSFLSFGMWEWITCAVLSACLLMLWRTRPSTASLTC